MKHHGNNPAGDYVLDEMKNNCTMTHKEAFTPAALDFISTMTECLFRVNRIPPNELHERVSCVVTSNTTFMSELEIRSYSKQLSPSRYNHLTKQIVHVLRTNDPVKCLTKHWIISKGRLQAIRTCLHNSSNQLCLWAGHEQNKRNPVPSFLPNYYVAVCTRNTR